MMKNILLTLLLTFLAVAVARRSGDLQKEMGKFPLFSLLFVHAAELRLTLPMLYQLSPFLYPHLFIIKVA
jgi:hypothetical protein